MAGAFWLAGLVDEFVIYVAPSLMGSTARPLIELPLNSMAEKVELETIDSRLIGPDWRITLKPVRR